MAVFGLVLDGGGNTAQCALLEEGQQIAFGEALGSVNPTVQAKDKALETLVKALSTALDKKTPGEPLNFVYAGVEGCFMGARQEWLRSVLSTHLLGLLSNKTKLIVTDTLYGSFRTASESPGGVMVSINGGIVITAIEPGDKNPGSRAGVHDTTPMYLRGPSLGLKIREILERRDPDRLRALYLQNPLAQTQVSLLTPLVFEPVVWSIMGPEVLANVHLAVELAMDKVRDGHIVLAGQPKQENALRGDLERAYGDQVVCSKGRPLEGMIRLATAGRVF